MGLFDTIKKSKEVNQNAEWKMGAIPTVVELNDDHIRIYNSATQEMVFYKDIKSVEQSVNIVNIRTNVRTYSLRYRKLRGGTDKAMEFTSLLSEKISQFKD